MSTSTEVKLSIREYGEIIRKELPYAVGLLFGAAAYLRNSSEFYRVAHECERAVDLEFIEPQTDEDFTKNLKVLSEMVLALSQASTLINNSFLDFVVNEGMTQTFMKFRDRFDEALQKESFTVLGASEEIVRRQKQWKLTAPSHFTGAK